MGGGIGGDDCILFIYIMYYSHTYSGIETNCKALENIQNLFLYFRQITDIPHHVASAVIHIYYENVLANT